MPLNTVYQWVSSPRVHCFYLPIVHETKCSFVYMEPPKGNIVDVNCL